MTIVFGFGTSIVMPSTSLMVACASNRVRHQILALLCYTVAYALYAQLLLEAFGNAYDHVVDQAAGQAVQCTVVLVVVRRRVTEFRCPPRCSCSDGIRG